MSHRPDLSYLSGNDPQQKQAIKEELPRKARMISQYLEGDEGDDETYDKFSAEGIGEKLNSLVRGDVIEVNNLYKDKDSGLEIGSGIHNTYTGAARIAVDHATRVYHDEELVLEVIGSSSSLENEQAEPSQIKEYHTGEWEEELDELIDEAESAYRKKTQEAREDRFGRCDNGFCDR